MGKAEDCLRRWGCYTSQVLLQLSHGTVSERCSKRTQHNDYHRQKNANKRVNQDRASFLEEKGDEKVIDSMDERVHLSAGNAYSLDSGDEIESAIDTQ